MSHEIPYSGLPPKPPTTISHLCGVKLTQSCYDCKEIRIVGRQQAVAHEEIDQHEVAVVFEFLRVAHGFEDAPHGQ